MHSNQSFWYTFLFCNILFFNSLVAQEAGTSLCDVKRIFEKDTLHLCPKEAITLPSLFVQDSITISWRFGSNVLASDTFTPSVNGTYIVSAKSTFCSIQDTFIVKLKVVPKLDFQATNTCLGTPINFRHRVILPNSKDSLYWQFGAGLILKTKDTLVQYSYSTAGTYNVSLTMLSQGCRDTVTRSIRVFANPIVTFSGLKDRYCLGDPVSNLVGNPLGGLFSGLNVTNVQNNPGRATFTPGNQPRLNSWVYYQFVDGNGCRSVDSQRVIGVFRPTSLALSPLDRRYCKDHPVVSVDLSPAGGVISGTGFTTNTERSKAFFDPRNHNGDAFLIYTYVDTNSCVSVIRDTTAALALPVVNLANIKSNFCLNEADVPLLATPAGGTFTGLGVISTGAGAVFRPSQLVQNNRIIYTYMDQNGCKGADTIIVNNVFPRPQVSLSALAPRYCTDHPVVEVSLSPAGGNLTGNRFVLNSEKNKATFNPINPGTAILSYTVTDANGCSSTASDTTISFATPVVNISTILPNYCVGDPDVVLNATPSGGIFSGTDVINLQNGRGVFRPSAVSKNNSIIYAYTDQNGCKGADTIVIKDVFARPQVSLSALAPRYCADAPPVEVTLSPAGGTISGNGFVLNAEKTKAIFTPRNPGSAVLNYTFTDANGCSASASATTISFALPAVRLTDISPTYCVGAPDVVLNASPAGGTFKGNNVIGNANGTGVFKPNTVEKNNTIIYTYTDQNSCTAADSFLVKEVFALPEVKLSGLNPDYCENSPKDTLIGLPAGGMFSGDNLTLAGNQGIFTTRTPKKYTFNYTYRDANGCVNTASFKTEVFAIPKINLGPDTFLVSGKTMVLNPKPENNPALRYQWSTGATTPSITIRNPGFYIVKVTLSSCVVMDTVFIEIKAINTKTTNIDIITYSKIYPNPSDELLSIELNPKYHLPKSTLNLFSLEGKKVYSKMMDRIPAGQLHKEIIDVRFLNSGFYFIYIDNIPLGKVMIDP